ncbi:MAG: hypothetical protein NTY53_06285 [Kiritimatiellaeota bacterium]|nr:hypothetical protein [Kiritimatiellota bacterium]
MKTGCAITPASVCRLDAPLLAAAAQRCAPRRVWLALLSMLIGASLIYGASFGLWHSPAQAALSALKMPLLLLSVAVVAAVANTLLAQTLGVRLTLAQTLLAMLLGMTITALLLAAVSPVFAFLALVLPGPDALDVTHIYARLLPLHTVAVGAAGLVGVLRLLRLLVALLGDARTARRLVVLWIAVCGLAGSELAWVASPFLNRPGDPPQLLNPYAFRMNMYEYLWALTLRPQTLPR